MPNSMYSSFSLACVVALIIIIVENLLLISHSCFSVFFILRSLRWKWNRWKQSVRQMPIANKFICKATTTIKFLKKKWNDKRFGCLMTKQTIRTYARVENKQTKNVQIEKNDLNGGLGMKQTRRTWMMEGHVAAPNHIG